MNRSDRPKPFLEASLVPEKERNGAAPAFDGLEDILLRRAHFSGVQG